MQSWSVAVRECVNILEALRKSETTSMPQDTHSSGSRLTKIIRLVAVEAFGDGKALFPTGFVKFFAEYARFRLQNLPDPSKKWLFPSLKSLHRNKPILHR